MILKMTKCKECLKYIDDEHIVVPIRDLSFLTLNGFWAFKLLESKGHKFKKKELKVMFKLFEKYAPAVHYWSSGRFYDFTEEDYKKFKGYKHKSYMI